MFALSNLHNWEPWPLSISWENLILQIKCDKEHSRHVYTELLKVRKTLFQHVTCYELFVCSIQPGFVVLFNIKKKNYLDSHFTSQKFLSGRVKQKQGSLNLDRKAEYTNKYIYFFKPFQTKYFVLSFSLEIINKSFGFFFMINSLRYNI